MKCWNPECFNNLSPEAASCPQCGWDRPTKKGAATVVVDAHHGHCENVERGQRCAERGGFSHSTRGGGPWYCRRHFFPNDQQTAVRPVGFAVAMLEDDEKRPDGRDWARLVLKRHTAGEVLPMISVEMANEAIDAPRGPSTLRIDTRAIGNVAKQMMREPGMEG